MDASVSRVFNRRENSITTSDYVSWVLIRFEIFRYIDVDRRISASSIIFLF